MRITVPMVPPSPNDLRRKYRNVFAYKKLREAWERSLAYGVPSAKERSELLLAARRRVRLKIMVFHSRRYDKDNLIGSIKPLLDALKNIQFITDDSEDWIDLVSVEQFYADRANQSTVIDIDPDV